jgi:hypothetical protein
MRFRHRAVLGVLAVAMGAGGLAAVVLGQAPGFGTPSASVARTPWGEPDLNGIWQVGYVFTPLERPKELAAKEFLTDDEVAALEREHAQKFSGDGAGGRARAKRGTDEDVAGAYNQVFSKGGAYRVIPVGRQPHLSGGLRQYLGDSRGRWDGETLVVEVTNFSDKTNFHGSAENLTLVERYTRTGPTCSHSASPSRIRPRLRVRGPSSCR